MKKLLILMALIVVTTIPTQALTYDEMIEDLKQGQIVFDLETREELHEFQTNGWKANLSSRWAGYYLFQNFRFQEHNFETMKPRITLTPREGSDLVKEQEAVTKHAIKTIETHNLKPTYRDIKRAFDIQRREYPKYKWGNFKPSDMLEGKGGNCTAMTWVFQETLNQLEVENRILETRVNGTLHIYNEFKIGDKWYKADITWGKWDFQEWGKF